MLSNLNQITPFEFDPLWMDDAQVCPVAPLHSVLIAHC